MVATSIQERREIGEKCVEILRSSNEWMTTTETLEEIRRNFSTEYSYLDRIETKPYLSKKNYLGLFVLSPLSKEGRIEKGRYLQPDYGWKIR